MTSKTTFVCDCCHRDAEAEIGWAQVKINEPDEKFDLCPICWDPLKALMHQLAAEAKDRTNATESGAEP